MTDVDLTDHEDVSSLLLRFWLPEATSFTSVTAYWGSDSSNYWSRTETTDMFGATMVEQAWNRLKFNWADATKTSSPDIAATDYLRIDLNYGAGYADATAARIDEIIMVRPEKMVLHYNSWAIAETSTSDSTKLYELTATTNVPWFSGTYDFFITYAAHKTAAILFREMGLYQDAEVEDREAEREKQKLNKKFPHSQLKVMKNFKVHGIRFNKHGTVEDVASVWFSGRPLARAGNRKDILGTTVPQYVKNVVSIYNKKV